jgi:hypothetical protein
VRTVPLKHLSMLPLVNGLGEPGENGESGWPRYVRTTDIGGPRELRRDVFASLPPALARKAPLNKGDIVMTAAGATVGKSLLYLENSPACFAGYLVRCRPRTAVDARFLSHWTQSDHYWLQIDAGAVRSTIDNFSASKYRSLLVPWPSADMRRRIADFLDDQVARLDAAVRAARQTQALLEERAVAAVTHRLTEANGRWRVDPSWSQAPVSAFFALDLGKMLNEERASGVRLRPYLRNTNVQWDRIDTSDLKEMHFEPGEGRVHGRGVRSGGHHVIRWVQVRR